MPFLSADKTITYAAKSGKALVHEEFFVQLVRDDEDIEILRKVFQFPQFQTGIDSC